MDYITVICDLKNSKEIANRESLQYKIIDMLKNCNNLYKDYIASPFLITLGDEWQGLLYDHSPYIEIINYFKSYLPKDIYFYTSIGIGKISIHNFELTVNQLDGPAFHLARKGIKYAKKNNCPLIILFNSW